ncbi:phage tail tube protein [Herbaspirillum sp.]|uniref:phage tail tube protein n=1 Tax=Herbaspirillum sp. TaxID=1890675 RepID=UPI001B065CA3|nr:phage tail tube protein [Herbaspirillum sp.]MBO9538764.1 phage tail tube protein [Herbaspirillum sp.]
MAKLNNIQSVSVPSIGKLPLAESGQSFTPSGKKRTHKAGRQAVDGGFTESSQAAKLELSLNLQGGLDIVAINNIEDEDITIRMADGSVHMMSMAFVENPITAGDGEGKVTFMSNESEQIS